MVEPEATMAEADEALAAEEALVQALRERHAEACTELCRRFGPRLHRFATARLAGDAELAEDLVVQAMADAVRNIRQFNPKKSTLSAWLYGIVRRQVSGERRRARRQNSVPASAHIPLEGAEDTRSEEDVSAEVASRLDAQRRVAEVADILSDVEFEVLVLNSVDELSAREIGCAPSDP
jgi:RNA polymerase sigma factor (sigma-70 family)